MTTDYQRLRTLRCAPRVLACGAVAALTLVAMTGPAAAGPTAAPAAVTSPSGVPVVATAATLEPAGMLMLDVGTAAAHDVAAEVAADGADPARSTQTRPHTSTAPTRPSTGSTRTTGDASGALYQADRAASVGQMLSSTTSCTASVVTSDTGNVAVTAAHCVHWPATGPMAYAFPSHGWAPIDEFIPGRAGDATPYGRWHIEQVWIDPRWRDTGDIGFDVAFLRLSRFDGHSIQQVVGSQGISFAAPAAGTAVTALGYPAEAPFDGRTLRRCSTSSVGIDRASENALTMPCAMTPGSSGGPWLTGFNTATGAGTVVAVTSFHDNTIPRRLAARPLADFAYALYQAADQADSR